MPDSSADEQSGEKPCSARLGGRVWGSSTGPSSNLVVGFADDIQSISDNGVTTSAADLVAVG
jgi:hypothetical protein